MLAHPSLPQIGKGLIPVVIQALENFIEMLILSHLDIHAQLFQSELHLGFTVAMIKDIYQLSNDISEALDKSLICSFQLLGRLPFLS